MENSLVIMLLGLPLCLALLLFVFKKYFFRRVILISALILMIAMPIMLAFIIKFMGNNISVFSEKLIPFPDINLIIKFANTLIVSFFVYYGFKKRRRIFFVGSSFLLIMLLILEIFWVHKMPETIFYVDMISVLFIFIASFFGLIMMLFISGSAEKKAFGKYFTRTRQSMYFVFSLLLISSISFLFIINNLALLIFFYNLISLFIFLILTRFRNEHMHEKAFESIEVNLLSQLFLVVSIVLIYNSLGTLSINDFTMAFAMTELKSQAILGICILCIAVIIRSFQFPFGKWLINSESIPSSVTGFILACIIMPTGIYVLLRILPVISGTTSSYIIAIIGALNYMFGALFAVSQKKLKDSLVYIVYSALGFIIYCASLGLYSVYSTSIVLSLMYPASLILLFMAVASIEYIIPDPDINSLQGLKMKTRFTAEFLFISSLTFILPSFIIFSSVWVSLGGILPAQGAALLIIVGFTATLLFFTRVIGSALEYSPNIKSESSTLTVFERIPVFITIAFILLLNIIIKPFFEYFIKPHAITVYTDKGYYITGYLTDIFITGREGLLAGQFPFFILFILCLALIAFYFYKANKKTSQNYHPPYICGENYEETVLGTDIATKGSKAYIQNYHFNNILNSKLASNIADIIFVSSILVLLGVINT